jgi:hypothetical protein
MAPLLPVGNRKGLYLLSGSLEVRVVAAVAQGSSRL